jgi:hypothetical protein
MGRLDVIFRRRDFERIYSENQNLRLQNKQLLVTLMKNLTKSSRKSSKKKNRFSGTLISSDHYNNPSKHRSKRRKHSYRKPSSKRRTRKEITLNNFSSLLDHNVPSLSAMHKNVMPFVQNYQSFDSTLSKPIDHSPLFFNNLPQNEKENNYMDDQYKEEEKRGKRRPKTAVRREKEIQ